jgi:hypothetical protein
MTLKKENISYKENRMLSCYNRHDSNQCVTLLYLAPQLLSEWPPLLHYMAFSVAILVQRSFDLKSSVLLAHTCKSVNKLFQPLLHLFSLLDHIVWSETDKAEAIYRKNPKLLLHRCSIKGPTDYPICNNITPFRYAVKTRDIPMLDRILGVTRDIKTGDIIKIDYTYLPQERVLQQLNDHNKEETGHHNLATLITMQQAYINSSRNRGPGYLVHQIGREQRNSPISTLMEYFHSRYSLALIPNFRENFKRNRELFDKKLFPLITNKGLGFDFAIRLHHGEVLLKKYHTPTTLGMIDWMRNGFGTDVPLSSEIELRFLIACENTRKLDLAKLISSIRFGISKTPLEQSQPTTRRPYCC